MKNFILLFVAALFVGCAPSGVQVTTDDEKSQAIKAAYDGYLVNDFTASNELYTDETAIYINSCLLYTSPSPRDLSTSRMPSSA